MKNVLILEDDEVDVLILMKILDPLDCIIQIARNYNEAKDFICNNQVDIAIIDLFMNGQKNGSDLVHELILKSSLIKIIIVTGSKSNSLLMNSYKSKVNYFFRKPYKPEEMINAVKTLL